MKSMKVITVAVIITLLTLLCGCNPMSSPQNGDNAMNVSVKAEYLI